MSKVKGLKSNLKRTHKLKRQNKAVAEVLQENRQVVNTPERVKARYNKRLERNKRLRANDPEVKVKEAHKGTAFAAEYLRKQLPQTVVNGLKKIINTNEAEKKVLRKQRQEIEAARPKVAKTKKTEATVSVTAPLNVEAPVTVNP